MSDTIAQAYAEKEAISARRDALRPKSPPRLGQPFPSIDIRELEAIEIAEYSWKTKWYSAAEGNAATRIYFMLEKEKEGLAETIDTLEEEADRPSLRGLDRLRSFAQLAEQVGIADRPPLPKATTLRGMYSWMEEFQSRLRQHSSQQPTGTHEQKPGQVALAEISTPAAPAKHGHPNRPQAVELESLTQAEVDAKIRKYKAEPRDLYNRLCRGIAKGSIEYKKKAIKVFGARAIARAIKCKSKTAVSNSQPWKAIASDMQFTKGSRPQRIGLNIALEKKSESIDDAAAEAVEAIEEKQNAEKEIKRRLPAGKAAEALLRSLQAGSMTPAEATQAVKILASKE